MAHRTLRSSMTSKRPLLYVFSTASVHTGASTRYPTSARAVSGVVIDEDIGVDRAPRGI
jgi:hypothetical protein